MLLVNSRLPQVDSSTAAKVWSRRYRAPHQLIQNCKVLILLFDTFEDVRRLSIQEMQVRRLCQECLAQAIKERAAFWKQRSKCPHPAIPINILMMYELIS